MGYLDGMGSCGGLWVVPGSGALGASCQPVLTKARFEWRCGIFPFVCIRLILALHNSTAGSAALAGGRRPLADSALEVFLRSVTSRNLRVPGLFRY